MTDIAHLTQQIRRIITEPNAFDPDMGANNPVLYPEDTDAMLEQRADAVEGLIRSKSQAPVTLQHRYEELCQAVEEFEKMVVWDNVPDAFEVAWNRVRRAAGLKVRERKIRQPSFRGWIVWFLVLVVTGTGAVTLSIHSLLEVL